MAEARWPNDHLVEGHVHRASYGGDGCDVCDDLFLVKVDELRTKTDRSMTMAKKKKNEIPEAARKFAELVNATVRWCEAGELTKVQCLEMLHDLAYSHQRFLFNAFREAEGNPLPEVKVETVALECVVCGNVHLQEELDAFWNAGNCPNFGQEGGS